MLPRTHTLFLVMYFEHSANDFILFLLLISTVFLWFGCIFNFDLFSDRIKYAAHNTTFTEFTNEYLETFKNENGYTCPSCACTAKLKRRLRYHLKHECGHFPCPSCGRSFKRKHDMLVHYNRNKCPI